MPEPSIFGFVEYIVFGLVAMSASAVKVLPRSIHVGKKKETPGAELDRGKPPSLGEGV
jgi:hypothetical protein